MRIEAKGGTHHKRQFLTECIGQCWKRSFGDWFRLAAVTGGMETKQWMSKASRVGMTWNSCKV